MLRFYFLAPIYRLQYLHFNTSHVTVLWSKKLQVSYGFTISIHLMLRFYAQSRAMGELRSNFNTSHVTVLYNKTTQQAGGDEISIHLMLRFYVCGQQQRLISINFNTSHVTVLYNPNAKIYTEYIFQYISCYGSILIYLIIQASPSISIHLMLRFYKVYDKELFSSIAFQYISCYGSMCTYKQTCNA